MSIEKITEIGGFARFTNDSINYVTCANESLKLIESLGLKGSLELKGLYISLLALPPDWKIHKNQIGIAFGVGEKKLDRYFAKLRKLGLLTIVQKRNKSGAFGDIDYRVHMLPSERVTPEGQKPYLPLTGGTGLTDYKVIDNTKLKINNTVSPSADGMSFEKFWGAYPLKRDEVVARKEFNKIKMSVKLMNTILDSVKKYTAEVRGIRASGGRSTFKYPGRWLKEKCWENDYANHDQVNSAKPKPKHDRCQAEGCGRPAYHEYNDESICDKHMQQIQNKRRR